MNVLRLSSRQPCLLRHARGPPAQRYRSQDDTPKAPTSFGEGESDDCDGPFLKLDDLQSGHEPATYQSVYPSGRRPARLQIYMAKSFVSRSAPARKLIKRFLYAIGRRTLALWGIAVAVVCLALAIGT